MNTLPSFKEDHISQIPALMLLVRLGYAYLTPDEALKARGGKKSNVILETILEEKLRNLDCNKISFKGNQYDFSNANITEAVNTLKNIPFDGLIRTNEAFYDLLSKPKSFEETIQDNKRSYDLHYIDWKTPENNVFHVTEEFEVETSDGQSHKRPDIVLFVNGIPLAVIECKRPDMKEPLEQAISQHIRNQKIDAIPKLFVPSQLLIAACANEAKYGTVGTEPKFWAKWKERELNLEALYQEVNTPVEPATMNKIFSQRFAYVKTYFEKLLAEKREVTEQDKLLHALCRPVRLLDLTRIFTVYDDGIKKIARHQQYRAVINALDRVRTFESSKQRKGGVIWHTQGSGKSITMVMLAKALMLDTSISNPRVVVVTDRTSLDKQIKKTFAHCGMEPEKARSGKDLLKLLNENKADIITTVLFKFRSAVNANKNTLDTSNVFVLVDESHRSQYATAHALMKKMLPGACYIGFTGTPLIKNDKKNTIAKFGQFIDTYTIDEATKEDKTVVPLLYEGRHNILKVNEAPINKWYNVVAEPLTKHESADLKKKMAQRRMLLSSEDHVRAIAYDVSSHYQKNFQGTGFKGQLAVQSKEDALKYKQFFDEFGMVSTAVVISAPDTREGHEDIHDEEPSEEVQKFWKKTMARFGDEESYNDQIITAFKEANEPEILIVVYKLLTGFDAPKNTVLYLARELREHTLLQAIARVNRLCDGKDYGFVIDYVGILDELDKALLTYSEWQGFDEEDLRGTILNVEKEIEKLPEYHGALKRMFQGIQNKRDEEEYERFLKPEDVRDEFYEKLSNFSRCFSVALSAAKFHEETNEYHMNIYKNDLKFFQKLRISVKRRFNEEINFNTYEKRVKKLLDTYVTSEKIIEVVPQVNIFEAEFKEEVNKHQSPGAKADKIASATQKTVHERMSEDPVFYEKFARLIQQAIDDFYAKRLSDAEYLKRVSQYSQQVFEKCDDDVPVSIRERDHARAFYGIVSRTFEKRTENKQDSNLAAEIGIEIEEIIQKNIFPNGQILVDWQNNHDVKNQTLNELEDFLADHITAEFSYEEIDEILEDVMKIAEARFKS